jgi:glycine cleavage system H protein
VTTPDDRGYTAEHQWAVTGDDGTCTVGITWFAQDELGEITYVDLPDKAERVTAGDTYGVIESIKTMSDLYAPVSGEVLEVNAALTDEPTLVNQDPYGQGWLIRIRPDDPAAAGSLLTAGQYDERHAT